MQCKVKVGDREYVVKSQPGEGLYIVRVQPPPLTAYGCKAVDVGVPFKLCAPGIELPRGAMIDSSDTSSIPDCDTPVLIVDVPFENLGTRNVELVLYCPDRRSCSPRALASFVGGCIDVVLPKTPPYRLNYNSLVFNNVSVMVYSNLREAVEWMVALLAARSGADYRWAERAAVKARNADFKIDKDKLVYFVAAVSSSSNE